ncbi:MAG TPA: hypothetical protein VG056_06135 [Pirellulales bacterium]|jgi:hypothetical protein|nr:hypothetical protein [Pirellulales bacterium]
MSRGRNVWRLLLIVAGSFLGLPVARPLHADTALTKEISPLLIPGGIADPDGTIVYLTNPKAGIDAVQLATGQLLWTARDMRPLIVAGGRLIAQAAVKDQPKQFMLAVLDAAQAGTRLAHSEPQTFPEWVSIDGELSHSFATECRVVGDTLILNWRADAWSSGGRSLLSTGEETERKAASGEIRMDLTTGKTVSKFDEKPVELTGPAEPRDATLGAYRVLLGESAEAGAGFSRNIKRSLRAFDAKSGKLLWEHALAPETVIPPAH